MHLKFMYSPHFTLHTFLPVFIKFITLFHYYSVLYPSLCTHSLCVYILLPPWLCVFQYFPFTAPSSSSLFVSVAQTVLLSLSGAE